MLGHEQLAFDKAMLPTSPHFQFPYTLNTRILSGQHKNHRLFEHQVLHN